MVAAPAPRALVLALLVLAPLVGSAGVAPPQSGPVVAHASYLGGSGLDTAYSVAVDAAGNTYLTGLTLSPDFPTREPAQGALAGGWDAFVAKLDASGQLVWSTYLGGTGNEVGRGIAVDGAGAVYVAGMTNSGDFPTLGPGQAASGGGWDAFVAKLDAAGRLVYSSYLGGSGDDRAGFGVAVDASGRAHVAGVTSSSDFPTRSPVQAGLAGARDAFVARVDAAGALVFSTYLGGSGDDSGNSVAADPAGGTLVTGSTLSTDFPTLGALQPRSGGSRDAFVARLDAAGKLAFSTYLGGSASDDAADVAPGPGGEAFVTGYTYSDDFPTLNPVQARRAFLADMFVAKLAADGTALVYSTYLGGGEEDFGNAIAVDGSGRVHLAGAVASPDFPVPCTFQGSHAGGFDAVVARLDASGSRLAYAGFLGGSADDFAYSIALDARDGAVVAGATVSAGFPTANATQTALAGSWDAFIARVEDVDTTPPVTTASLSGVKGNQGWWRSAVELALTAADCTSGVAATHVSLDGALFREGTSLLVEGDGEHTVSFYSVDAAGNAEAPRSVALRIDATPPSVAVAHPREGSVYANGLRLPVEEPLPRTLVAGAMEVRADAADAASGVESVAFHLDGALRAVATQPPYGFAWAAGDEALGNHTILVRAVDRAGNEAWASRVATTVPTTAEGVARTLG